MIDTTPARELAKQHVAFACIPSDVQELYLSAMESAYVRGATAQLHDMNERMRAEIDGLRSAAVAPVRGE